MSTTAPITRADWAHQRLRAAILTGELAPGMKLLADDPHGEHIALRDAALRGRVEPAVTVLVTHLQATLTAARTAIQAAATTNTAPRRRAGKRS